jgi:hypothetical protein
MCRYDILFTRIDQINLIGHNIFEEKKIIIEIYEYYKPLFFELQVCVFLIHSHIPSVHVEYGSLI